MNTVAISLLILSCIWGTAISFLGVFARAALIQQCAGPSIRLFNLFDLAGFLCLENISATTFNVMGNANKMLTLVVNGLLWEHHASIQVSSQDSKWLPGRPISRSSYCLSG